MRCADYWEPQTEEKVAMVYQMYKDDNVQMEDIEKVIQRFGNQSLDFFGAIRACTYDNQILCAPPHHLECLRS